MEIEANIYNYNKNDFVSFNCKFYAPPFGLHNVYNTLAAITTFSTFTKYYDYISETITNVFGEMDMSVLPPGRFEIIEVNGKLVGLGQGDNGDAFNANIKYMIPYANGNLEFFYTTPDTNEEEIFEDHIKSISKINPYHLTVVLGRTSV